MLKRGASGKTCIDIMPPLQPVTFAELPTQQNYSAIAQGRKVDQATPEIFQLYAERLELSNQSGHFHEICGIRDAVGDASASMLGIFRCLVGSALLRNDPGMSTLDLLNQRAD